MTIKENKTIYLIRHGEIEPQYKGRFVGSTDVVLGRSGFDQARDLAAKIKIINPDLCFSSPLNRARGTAETAMSSLGIDICYDEDLREIDFGAWECMTFEEIVNQYPADVERWAVLSPDFSFPGGESLKDFLRRIRAAAERIEKSAGNSIAVFSHGGVIKSLLCLWLGLPPEKYIIFNIMPASIAFIDLYGNKGVLSGLDNSIAKEV